MVSLCWTIVAPSKPGCSAGAFGNFVTKHLGNNALVSASYTNSSAGIALGSRIGSLLGPVGAFAGGVVGSMFGTGANLSYVPSTGSLYLGGQISAGAGYNGGSGISFSFINVPSSQNPNSIANGLSYSGAFQPLPVLGSTVTKSPGSVSYSICIRHCGC